MYENYFGLSEAPFSIAPDPRYLYMSQRHQEALAHLLYGVNGDGGFVLLTGEVGAGKTTVCRCLLQQIPESCDVAYIFNPKLTVEELLSTICMEFGIAYPAGNNSIKVFVDCINAYLLDAHARGRHTVLVIDEAQNLSPDVLEQMRLLTNLETNRRKLLQIILLGQPELADMLARPELKQLAQRIIARYHLGPLSRAEVAAYVRHRLDIAGAKRPLFPLSVMNRLYRLSRGIPRVVNVLCDRALLGAYVQGKERVDRATIDQAAREVFHKPASRPLGIPNAIAFALILLVGTTAGAMVYHYAQPGTDGAAGEPGLLNRSGEKSANSVKDVKPPVATLAALRWPAAAARANSHALADSALLHAWGAESQGGDLCKEARRYDLRCRIARGSLDDLRTANRPAVLHLRDANGEDFYATLTRLDGANASFSVGGETQTVPIAALAGQWSGEHTLVWRAPPDMATIHPGARGAAADWLARELAQLHGRSAAPTTGQSYDEAMVREIKEFQLAHGLTPDGAVGQQTQIRLSAAADPKAPKLASDK
jgi:general secretion pathway protein A